MLKPRKPPAKKPIAKLYPAAPVAEQWNHLLPVPTESAIMGVVDRLTGIAIQDNVIAQAIVEGTPLTGYEYVKTQIAMLQAAKILHTGKLYTDSIAQSITPFVGKPLSLLADLWYCGAVLYDKFDETIIHDTSWDWLGKYLESNRGKLKELGIIPDVFTDDELISDSGSQVIYTPKHYAKVYFIRQYLKGNSYGDAFKNYCEEIRRVGGKDRKASGGSTAFARKPAPGTKAGNTANTGATFRLKPRPAKK